MGEEYFKKASELVSRHQELFVGPEVLSSKRRYLRANQLIASAAYITSMLAFEKVNAPVVVHCRGRLNFYREIRQRSCSTHGEHCVSITAFG